jgi:hypothetical protein
MARPASTTINCPSCQQPFSAIVEQIIDTSVDPTSKERLLSGRVNLIVCPHCGYRGMVNAPLLYHDASKQLAIIYVPMELGLDQVTREKRIGDMTNALIRFLPEDAPKGYLLQPKSALTLQGLIEQILEADGITPDMLDAERRKVDLIELLGNAGDEERDSLLAENQELVDVEFLEMMAVAAQAASQAGDARTSIRLLNVRSHLVETTEAGQAIKARDEAIAEASQEMEALGENLTREAFVDLLVKAADNPMKIEVLAALGRPLLDYTTFQLLTDQADHAASAELKQTIVAIRERLLAINAAYEQQARALVQRATDTLQMLLQSADIETAIHNNLNRIDDMFLRVLQATLEDARQKGNIEVSGRLKLIRDEVLKLLQAAAPPEVQLINELLSAESDDAALQILHSRQDGISENLLAVMEDLAGQLREAGNQAAAERLDMLQGEAQQLLPS